MVIPLPLAECLMRVRNLPEFQPLRDYFVAEKAKHVAFMTGSNEDRPMIVAQGMIRQLNAITDLIEQAPAVLDKRSP